MSLVPTFVRLDDGRLYGDPIIADDTGDWFLCFDDDEPPELVMKKGDPQTLRERAENICSEIGLDADVQKDMSSHPRARLRSDSLRPFPPEWDDYEKSEAVFLDIKNPPPAALACRREDLPSYETPGGIPGEHVFYDWPNAAGNE